MWTEDRADRVRRLWEGGQHSASDIAYAVGGVTRNAVIGLVRRRNWEGGSEPPHAHAGGRGKQHDHDAILDRWERGESERLIGDILGIPRRSVGRIVCEARQSGDPRAIYHGRGYYRGPRKPRAVKPKAVAALKPKLKPPARVPVAEPDSKNLSLLTLEPDQCRWPHGTSPYLFCGQPVDDGRSYCPYHRGIAYLPRESQGRTNRNVRYLMRHA